MEINANEMGFWNKMKEVLAEAFSKKEENVVEEPQIEEVALEEQPATEPVDHSNGLNGSNTAVPAAPEPAPEPVNEPEPVVEPQPEPEPVQEPQNEPVVEEPKVDVGKLEELIGNLKAEIDALKATNTGLQEKISEMGKQPSAAPVNVNAKPSASDSFDNWMETMRSLVG